MGRTAKPTEKLTPDQQQLVEDNRGLLYAILNSYRRRHTHPDLIDELEFEGLKVLCRVARKFDPARGIKFSTLATLSIKRGFVNVFKRRQLVTVSGLEGHKLVDYRERGELNLEREELRQRLENLVKRLARVDRDAALVVRMRLDGYLFKDAGERIGKTKQTAANAWLRGLVWLRKRVA